MSNLPKFSSNKKYRMTYNRLVFGDLCQCPDYGLELQERYVRKYLWYLWCQCCHRKYRATARGGTWLYDMKLTPKQLFVLLCFTRLYLSSFRNGNKPEELLKLLGTGHRTALFFNAQDWKSEEDRAIDLAAESERLKSIGLQLEEVDLQDYFAEPDELEQRLSEYDLI